MYKKLVIVLDLSRKKFSIACTKRIIIVLNDVFGCAKAIVVGLSYFRKRICLYNHKDHSYCVHLPSKIWVVMVVFVSEMNVFLCKEKIVVLVFINWKYFSLLV